MNLFERTEARMRAMSTAELADHLKRLPWSDAEWTLSTALRVALEKISTLEGKATAGPTRPARKSPRRLLAAAWRWLTREKHPEPGPYTQQELDDAWR